MKNQTTVEQFPSSMSELLYYFRDYDDKNSIFPVEVGNLPTFISYRSVTWSSPLRFLTRFRNHLKRRDGEVAENRVNDEKK